MLRKLTSLPAPLCYIVPGALIVLIVWLCITVPKWLGSFKPEVEFSEDLKNYSPAYVDVVSIKPSEEKFVSSSKYNLYCSCELVNGDIIWVQFDRTQYVANIGYLWDEKTYETPLRLHGVVETVGKVIKAFNSNNNVILVVDSVDVPVDPASTT